MVVKMATVIIYKGKGYLSTWGQIENNGPYMAIEPVYVTNLNETDLIDAIEKVTSTGIPLLPKLTHDQAKKRIDPMLRATKAKSWKALAKNGATYSIDWNSDTITLYMSRLDKKGRFESDPNKTRSFSIETPLRVIVEAILADVRSRSELGVQ